ncbi:hypothetical protein [Listeria booriae]|uniref:hypothetical protein n=1 Tax=Listeria booriae TaxID=1552123 RepID=UPI001624BCB5|nr:hypothetical protein [Listeria booriae]MBC2190211.1 hypothetical protein [Listeria booriae]
MNNSQKKYDFYIYALVMFAGIMIASRLEPWIGEKAVTIIQLILFCVCAPIIIWMRWQNRKVDKQNKDS